MMFESVANKSNLNHLIYYENEHVRALVAEVSFDQGKWHMHHTAATKILKDDAMQKLRVWIKERIDMFTVTRKMMQ